MLLVKINKIVLYKIILDYLITIMENKISNIYAKWKGL